MDVSSAVHTRMSSDTFHPPSAVAAFTFSVGVNLLTTGFVSMILNKTAHKKILDYIPILINITSEDYFNSEFKGDNRAWRLDKFIQILKDNPNRYDIFFRKMCEYSKEYNSISYTYDESPEIYNRSIMNNGMHCENAEELIVLFNEPHTYIHVYNWVILSLSCQ